MHAPENPKPEHKVMAYARQIDKANEGMSLFAEGGAKPRA